MKSVFILFSYLCIKKIFLKKAKKKRLREDPTRVCKEKVTETRPLCFLPTIPDYWIFFHSAGISWSFFSFIICFSMPPMIHPLMAIGNGKEREFKRIEWQLKRKDQL